MSQEPIAKLDKKDLAHGFRIYERTVKKIYLPYEVTPGQTARQKVVWVLLKLGWKQEEIAEAIGVTQPAITKLISVLRQNSDI